MLRTVVHQTYTSNLAVDTSGMFNQGISINVTAHYPGFGFTQPGSRINVQPSRSLRNLGCIRAAVSFNLQPQGAVHRYNLMEGFESFALFVNPDNSLSGTIFDANSNWTGATSAPAMVATGSTHTAGIECDGINMVRIFLDGAIVGENYNVLGSVRDIGFMGLAIGHWPNPPGQYTFEGTIFEVLLQKYDPAADLTKVLDPCCFNTAALLRWYTRVAGKGASIGKLSQAADALWAASKSAAIALRGGSKAATETQQALAATLTNALRRRDLSAVEFVLTQLQTSATGQLNAATVKKLGDDVRQAIADFDLQWSDWCDFLRLVCLDPCGNQGTECHHGN
jgi:hypothetical protein